MTVVLALAQTAVAGKWESETKDGKALVDLKVDGKAISGTFAISGGVFQIEAGKVIDSKTISFSWTTAFPPQGNPIRRVATGKVTGAEIKLTIDGVIES